jgi:hypothetical protein
VVPKKARRILCVVTEHVAKPFIRVGERNDHDFHHCPGSRVHRYWLGALAEGGAPSEQGPTASDPAASSQNANLNTSGTNASKSGSGTSTSGVSDANGEQGRDKMPDSSIDVRPYDKLNKRQK